MASGFEIIDTWDASTSTIVAPALPAICRCEPGVMMRSWVPMTAQAGMPRQAGGPDGSPKPALKVTANFKDPQWQAARTDEALIASIRDGRPGTTMIAWKDRLTPEQIAAVVAHIRTLAVAQ